MVEGLGVKRFVEMCVVIRQLSVGITVNTVPLNFAVSNEYNNINSQYYFFFRKSFSCLKLCVICDYRIL